VKEPWPRLSSWREMALATVLIALAILGVTLPFWLPITPN
jgi:hypothetical protein